MDDSDFHSEESVNRTVKRIYVDVEELKEGQAKIQRELPRLTLAVFGASPDEKHMHPAPGLVEQVNSYQPVVNAVSNLIVVVKSAAWSFLGAIVLLIVNLLQQAFFS